MRRHLPASAAYMESSEEIETSVTSCEMVAPLLALAASHSMDSNHLSLYDPDRFRGSSNNLHIEVGLDLCLLLFGLLNATLPLVTTDKRDDAIEVCHHRKHESSW